eukprot:11864960-Ditylum_brightwellii.AAC.1
MVDHAIDFVYCHLIRGTTVDNILAVKHAYDCLVSQFDHRGHSYNQDNSRFDSKELEDSCHKA